jgi:hypothetical protein
MSESNRWRVPVFQGGTHAISPHPFSPEEALYGQITHDEKLIATRSTQAAETYAHTFIQ